MNRKISVNLALAIAIIAMTVTFSVTMILSQNIFDKTVSSVREKEVMYNKLAEIDKEVRARYAGELNNDTLLDYLGTGYMQGTGDANGRYYSATRYQEYLSEQSGTVVGVGVDVVKEQGAYPRVSRVYENSPATEAGFAQGDAIVKVDDYDLRTLTLEQINRVLRGEAGTTANIVVQTVGGVELPAVGLQRRQYDMPTVQIQRRGEEALWYVKISTFSSTTAADLKRVLEQMAQDAVGFKGLVIDVRNNTGGSLEAALDTIDVLCPAGPIASQQNKNGSVVLLQSSDSLGVEVPVVVLMNNQTAAGAELLATSVQDFAMDGRLVGMATAGKGGIVSAPHRLNDGSAIAYTVGQLLTKNDVPITGNGAKPDIEAVLKPEEERNFYELTFESDSQISKAFEVLRTLLMSAPTGSSAATSSTSQGAEAASGSTASTATADGASSAASTQSDASASASAP